MDSLKNQSLFVLATAVAKSRALLLVGLCAVSASTAHAGLAEGVDAYKRSDYAVALTEFLAAAQQGDATAHRNLGVMYALGRGVEPDDRQAVDWFRRAAEQGLADAQRNLGLMYESGRGVEQNAEQAVYWFRLAAEQGHAPAQFNLARMFRLGRGVAKDDKEAAVWYRRAAEQGDADAQNNLGVMYKYAHGVPYSRVIAYALYSLSFATDSSTNNQTASDNRAALRPKMTSRELLAAQELVAKLGKPGLFAQALDEAERGTLSKQ